MSDTRTRQRLAPRVAPAMAIDALGPWAIPGVAALVAITSAVLTSLGMVAAPPGLAVTIFSVLALLAHLGLRSALEGVRAAGSRGIVLAVAAAWIGLCYLPFHALLFPGSPLHAPVRLSAGDTSLPVTIPTGGYRALDVLLEAELPSTPGGGMAIPVTYALTVEDAQHTRQVLSGRFDENLRTQRLGRRGTATIVQQHHAERRLLSNPARSDLTLTSLVLEPASGAAVTVTAYPHRLPPVAGLVVLAGALLAAAIAVDVRVVPDSEGTFTLATAGVVGAAAVFWTSNTVHPTVSSVIGSAIFGGPLGVVTGALVWWIARRTIARAR